MKRNKVIPHRMEKGQVLVLVALSFIALVAVIGLAIDVGFMFVGYARLRRGVDAAALAASAQFREGYTAAQLNSAAEEFLVLNAIDDPTATVDTCDTDVTLCPAPRPPLCDPWDPLNPDCPPARKLVRVQATTTVKLNFLPVIGIDNAPLSASATAEAASVDVVLAIDTSESMTREAITNADPSDDYLLDPSICNAEDPLGTGDLDYPAPGNCHPFNEVKKAALAFIDELYFPYDRVGVVTFDRLAIQKLDLTANKTDIQDVIKSLYVYDAVLRPEDPFGNVDGRCLLDPAGPNGWPVNPIPGPCRWYDGVTGAYNGFYCPVYDNGNAAVTPTIQIGDPSTCPTTDIGDGLRMAGNMLADPAKRRDESLWVVILLTDGMANASLGDAFHPYGFCPNANPPSDTTWDSNPFCIDKNPHTYHDPVTDPTHYDADDYAHDMVDFLANENNVLIYAIGLGPIVQSSYGGFDPLGETFLQYAANQGDGLYYFSPDGDQLRALFQKIANNIATRITK
jgi:hypothetical protein